MKEQLVQGFWKTVFLRHFFNYKSDKLLHCHQVSPPSKKTIDQHIFPISTFWIFPFQQSNRLLAKLTTHVTEMQRPLGRNAQSYVT